MALRKYDFCFCNAFRHFSSVAINIVILFSVVAISLCLSISTYGIMVSRIFSYVKHCRTLPSNFFCNSLAKKLD